MVKLAVMGGVFLDANLLVVSLLGSLRVRGTRKESKGECNQSNVFLRNVSCKCDGEEKRDEGKLKCRDTEGTLIGKGTSPCEMSRNKTNLSLDKIPLPRLPMKIYCYFPPNFCKFLKNYSEFCVTPFVTWFAYYSFFNSFIWMTYIVSHKY